MLKKLLLFSLLAAAPNSVLAEEVEAFTWAHTLTMESVTNLQGGLKTGTHNLANLDLTLSVDTQAAGWWDDGTLFAYVLGDYGRPPSALTGEYQTLSNIEAYNNLLLYEFWYEHSFADGAVKLLIGVHDYNSTFYVLESASLFNLSSMGVGPEVAQTSPSIFPVTAAAVHLTVNHDNQYFLLAAYDGIPGDLAHERGTRIKFGKDDGLYIATEWGWYEPNQFKFAVGGWKHTAKVQNPINEEPSDSNHGFYLLGEKYWNESFATFVQYGKADPNKNQLSDYLGTGFSYKNGLIDGDNLGMAYARAKNSDKYVAVNPDVYSAETVIELSYFRPLTKKLSFQTSAYWVEHPSMAPDLDNSVALGLRLYFEI